jgi:hypothetical protein
LTHAFGLAAHLGSRHSGRSDASTGRIVEDVKSTPTPTIASPDTPEAASAAGTARSIPAR